ncbi:hypothetical protein DCO44_09865 [Acinetobacter sp. AM]|uniref:ribbon-helix-helix domain-containing protein n=1 Tax=Acinetobacter sp. AM TaxID=2170730 RepID=UPI000DE621BC|nr:ribbon-helix-helix domain-containing protein [Acinetobacter sp. AM]PWB14209.1 hypothetical protein DCO44_09865 [Acinetobacter sp. AM]
MGTETSPQNRPRSKKITGGRVRFNVYLPKEEADAINKLANQTQQSQSSIITKFYLLGKNINQEG